jgi:hypothetical protein
LNGTAVHTSIAFPSTVYGRYAQVRISAAIFASYAENPLDFTAVTPNRGATGDHEEEWHEAHARDVRRRSWAAQAPFLPAQPRAWRTRGADHSIEDRDGWLKLWRWRVARLCGELN